VVEAEEKAKAGISVAVEVGILVAEAGISVAVEVGILVAEAGILVVAEMTGSKRVASNHRP